MIEPGTTPPFDGVRQVIAALQSAGIEVALGGSGLLLAHGLVHSVRDWDLTTEADISAVEAALESANLSFEGSRGDTTTYDTRWRILIDGGDHDIDLMIGFAIRQPAGSVAIPTIVSGTWHDLPLGSLEVWLVAYRLMHRADKPDHVARHLRQHGAELANVQRMLEQPLPVELRQELLALTNPSTTP